MKCLPLILSIGSNFLLRGDAARLLRGPQDEAAARSAPAVSSTVSDAGVQNAGTSAEESPSQTSKTAIASTVSDKEEQSRTIAEDAPSQETAPVVSTASEAEEQSTSTVEEDSPSQKPSTSPQITETSENKEKKPPVDVYYVSELLDRFLQATIRKRQMSNQRHALEIKRLQAAIPLAPTEKDKWALDQAAEGNEELHLESRNAFLEMENFANTLKQMMGARGTSKSCEDLTCGNHAYCKMTKSEGAICQCNDGYDGDGFVCNVGKHTVIRRLTSDEAQAYDINLSVYNGTRNVACVYQGEDTGYLTLGEVSPITVSWTPPMKFAKMNTFNPVVTGLPSGRIAIAFRDKLKKGNGFIVGADMTSSTNAAFNTPFEFAHNQEEAMRIISLPENHVAVFYSGHKLKGEPEDGFGAVGLFQVGQKGAITFIGTFRFTEFPVTEIRATLLSPKEFVIAYRHVQNEIGVEKQEGSVVYGSFYDGEIVIDPHPLSTEPLEVGVWARDVMLVSLNTFAYGYYLAKSEEVKVALIKVDPATHKMTKLSTSTIGHGFTPFINGISLAYAPREPRTYFYWKNGVKSAANSCSVLTTLSQCTESTWTEYDVQSASAQSIGDSRILMAFTDAEHTPWFQIVALAA